MTVPPEQKEPEKKEPERKAGEPAESGSPGASYREDQGRHARMAAFWTLIAFLLFGCNFLHDILVHWESLTLPIGGIRIPVVGIDLTPAFVVGALLFSAGALLIRRWHQRPKIADLLIDTEAELKKVTWPGGREVWNASIVVIVSVVLLGCFLAAADIFLFRLMRYVILGIS